MPAKEGRRLNQYLAACGLGSRRKCEELITSGRVEVNGSPCLVLSTRVMPQDHVRVDGKRMVPKESITVIFHKPRGLVCSRNDELGRETIYSLLPEALQSLHHVGRLDLDSEGLLILTNDGELSQELMHPSKSVEKEYLVTANQSFENAHLDQFLEGVYTAEGKLRAKSLERLSPRRLKVVLDHGAKRQIRLMLEALGYEVTKLMRVRIGNLWLGDLAPGDWALLNSKEIAMLLGKTTATPEARTSEKRRFSPPRKSHGTNDNKRTPPPRRPR
jgi:23S rRNA pseudouridine2605 synthase